MNEPLLCVDIGGTATKAAVLDAAGELHFAGTILTEPPADSYFRALCSLIERTRAAGLAESHRIAGMGIAIAGFLNPERDRLLYNPNLSWLEQFPLREKLSRHFDLPIELESDSNAACMAEHHFGSGRNSTRFLCVTAGTGLGAGMSVAGQPLRFAYGCLGDIGHIIVRPGGPLCYCGGRGCAEILISAPALAKRFAERSAIAMPLTLRQVIDAANAANAVAIAVLREAGEALGIAIASMANILFPDRIAVAGGLSAAADFVLQPAEEIFRESASILARSNVSFTRAVLGPSATLIGAAWPFWKTATMENHGESISG